MLGYEGYIQIGSTILGVGSSSPRVRPRLDSGGGYGGTISGATTGIGAPHDYDWTQYDGSVNFELTSDLFTTLKTWMTARTGTTNIILRSRKGNVQQYSTAYWNSISLSASDGAAVEGSVGFTAVSRTSYSYGDSGVVGYTGNPNGVAPVNPLNPSANNQNPIPFWDTEVTIGSTTDFITWSLDLSQEVVKFFGCKGNNATPQEPMYLGVGPMTATFTGTYLFTDVPADSVSGTIDIGSGSVTMNRMELQSASDDVQTGDALVPVNIEYFIYELA